MNLESRIQIISIQTFGKRLENLVNEINFNFIVIDEAHHVIAPEYLKVLRKYPNVKILGLTATPFLTKNEEWLGDVFSCRLKGPSVQELLDQNYLVPPVFIQSSVSRGMLGSKAAKCQSEMKMIVSRWKKKFANKKTLAFCIDINHASNLCKEFKLQGIEAQVLTGRLGKEARDRLFEKSRSKELSVLCTVDVVSEGVDTTWIDCILLLRPTLSKSLFIQQVGRGLRLYDGKECFIMLDEVGNVWKHGFVQQYTATESEAETLKVKIYECRNFENCYGLVPTKNERCFICWKKYGQKGASQD